MFKPNRGRKRCGLLLEILEDRTLPNIVPVLTLPATSFTVVKTATLTVVASATDKDSGEILNFSLVNAPAGVSISSKQIASSKGSAATGTLTWNPPPTEDQGPASYTFTVVVTDNGSPVKSASQTITVTTLAAGLVGNDLWIIGTSLNQGTATNPGNDTVSVSATNSANTVSVNVNGATSNFTIPAGGRILAKLFAGNDSFTLNEGTGTQPIAPALFVDEGTGTNNLIINGTAGPDSFSITGTTVSLAGAGTLTYANVQTLAVNGLGGNDTFAMTGINLSTATTLDGGADTNSFSGTFSSGFTGSLTLANMQTATLSVTGGLTAGSTITGTNFTGVNVDTLAGTLLASGGSITNATIGSITSTGLLEATETSAGSAGVLSYSTIGSVAGTVLAGSIVHTNIGSIAPGGKVKAAGQGTTTNVSIGTLGGSFIAPEDSNAGSGVMTDTSIDSITSTGLVSTGSISGMSVGTTDSGSSITAAGQGTTTNVSIGTLGGSFIAPEDSNAGSGVMTGTSIDSITSTGLVSTGSISGMSVGTTDSGSSITAAGQGTTTNVSIGTLGGSFIAPEDSNAGSGVMTGTSIDSITSTGLVSTGSISGMSVGTADSGSSITAAGQGTTTNVSIGTLGGSFIAPEDSNAGSGVMTGTSIDSITSTGLVSTGSISGMSVGSTDSGSSITAAGQGTTTNVSIGTLGGSFIAPEDSNAGSGVMTDTSIDSITSTGLVSTGSISGMSVGTTDSGSSITAAGLGTVNNLKISKHGGTLSAKKDTTPNSGSLTNTTIGTLTITGTVSSYTASNLTITSVGGKVNVTNTLTNFSAGTLLNTANLSAGHFLTVTARHVSPFVNFIEPTVTRTVAVTPHGSNGSIPDYSLYYDGNGSGNPQVTVQFNAPVPASFDLGVTTSTATTPGNGFDLAGLYSINGNPTGIHNVVVGGNLLLGAVPSGAVTFLGLQPGTTGGVQLPNDVVAVAVAGTLPAGSIMAKSVPAVAASSFAGVAADVANGSTAMTSLAAGTGVSQANDTFQVFFSEAAHVAQFLATGPGGSFDSKGMLFADIVNDNAPVTASDALVPTGSSTSVNSVIFTGQGGSLTTSQPILTSISAVPGGSIGNLILSASGGITANVTADRIIGNIDATNGGISSILETTKGDFGSAITDAGGTITGVTFVHTGGGGLTGKILAKGNLVSQLNLRSGLDGVVATDGDIGVIQTSGGIATLKSDGSLIRFGGIVVSNGGVNGQVIALGNVFGDISVTGGLSGRIAAKGNPGEFGLPSFRYGILGNVSIGGGISPTGAVVSSGLLGDDGTDNVPVDNSGTRLTISGNDKGILAAGEDINFGSTGSLNAAGLFENATGSNLNAINSIFTDKGALLDVIDPAQLNLIVQDLLALKVSNGMLTGTNI
jgi:hypothetical protein